MNKREMYLINVWCKLDNAFGALDKVMHSASLDDNELTDKERVRARSMAMEIDNQRTIIMRKLGFEDYDEFVDYLEENKKAVWNKITSNWEVPYEIYL